MENAKLAIIVAYLVKVQLPMIVLVVIQVFIFVVKIRLKYKFLKRLLFVEWQL